MDELNRELSTLIQGQEHRAIALGGGNTARLTDAGLLPRGSRLFLKVAFEGEQGTSLGNVKGTIFLQAKPEFDAATQVLSFGDIDFTLDTKSTLQGVALEYTSRLLKPLVLEEVRKRLVVDVSSVLAKARAEANNMADRLSLPAPLKLDFKLQSLRAQSIGVRSDTLYADFEASGRAKVTY